MQIKQQFHIYLLVSPQTTLYLNKIELYMLCLPIDFYYITI